MGSLRFELRLQHPERHRIPGYPTTPPQSLIRVEIVNNLFMGEQHSPATVSVQTEIVEDFFRILTCISALLELFP